MLKSNTFTQIAAALRTTADQVEKIATINDSNPKGAMKALASLMLDLADTCEFTAKNIVGALLASGDIRPQPPKDLGNGNVCICGQCKPRAPSERPS